MRWTNFAVLGGSLWFSCLGSGYASVLSKESLLVRRQDPPTPNDGSFVFRGDGRSPQEIRAMGGFRPQGDGWENYDCSFDLGRHYDAGPGGCGMDDSDEPDFVFRTAYVSAALDRSTAEQYGRWLYEIRATPNILDVHYAETEVLALGGIHWRQIRRYTRMAESDDNRVNERSWINNPEYDVQTYERGPNAFRCRVNSRRPGVLAGEPDSDSDGDSDGDSDSAMEELPQDGAQGRLFAAADRFMDQTPGIFELYGEFPPRFTPYAPRNDIPGPHHQPSPPEQAESPDAQVSRMLRHYTDMGLPELRRRFPDGDHLLQDLLRDINRGGCPLIGFGSHFKRSGLAVDLIARKAAPGKQSCCKLFTGFRKAVRKNSKSGVCKAKPKHHPLAEILWVKINDIDGEDPGDLYGSVTVTDKLGPQTIYHVEKAYPTSVSPGEVLGLRRSRPIAADGDFTIKLDLWDSDFFSPNDEVSAGQISWKASDTKNEYDKVMQREVNGDQGKATVSYVVMRNAAKAVVQVILINGDGEDPADIFGRIRVSSRFVQRDLYNRERSEHIRTGEAIPLSGAAMAVPMDDTLTVHVHLWDHDSDLSPNDLLVHSSAAFKPQTSGTEKKRLKGPDGEVEVSVTWEGDQHKGC